MSVILTWTSFLRFMSGSDVIYYCFYVLAPWFLTDTLARLRPFPFFRRCFVTPFGFTVFLLITHFLMSSLRR